MITNFDILYFNIITEDQEQEKNINDIGPIIPENPIYQNTKLVLIPSSVKIPNKIILNTIQQYTNISDNILVFISNISKTTISNKTLSKSNLQPIAKLIATIKELNLKNNDIDDICNQIINNSNTITYNKLLMLLNKLIEQFNLYRNIYDRYIQEINKIIEQLNKNLFKSVNYSTSNEEITPSKVKQIFDNFIKENNLQNNINVYISEKQSPMLDIVSYVNNNCKDCIIYLGSLNLYDSAKNWDSFLKMFGKNPTNQIVPYAISKK